MNETYDIVTVADLLKVPSERRRACLLQLELALELAEFAGGEGGPIEVHGFRWTDDGDRSIHVVQPDGSVPLTLKVEGPLQ